MKLVKTDIACENCKHFRVDGEVMECRGSYPVVTAIPIPQQNPLTGEKGIGITPVTLWPQVKKGDYCGKFKALDKALNLPN